MPVWKSNFGRPTPSTRRCLRSCVCSTAWRFTKVHSIFLLKDNLTSLVDFHADINNTAALYFATTESFHVGVIDAGVIASLFGWMNLFARSSGGIASDLGNKVSGMRGRLIAQSLILIIEGVLLIIFARQNHIGSAIPCLVAWSFFVQAAEGATFGIVPYVCPEGLGGVCAVVGAWGNIGAVAWGMMFKFGYIGNFEQGYIAMGYIIIASSVFSIFMRIKGQKTMFGTLEDQ